MQSIVDELLAAELAHDWAKAKTIHPYLARQSDAQLDRGYAATRAQTATLRGVPVQLAPMTWRTSWLHVAHDDAGSGRTTGVFCQRWSIDVAARVITFEDAQVLGHFSGWLGPDQIPGDVLARC